MARAPRLAVFDCDGTLIDGQASICDAMEAAFAELGLAAPDRNLVRRAVGLSLPQAARMLLPHRDADTHRAIAEAYKRAFREARQQDRIAQPLFEGMAPLIERLRSAGWQLAIATGMSDRGLEHCLAAHGLSDRFISLQTADRHPSKPHPAMLEAALAEAGADPSDAVMIGDTVFDVTMACDAGVRAIGVAWGYHEPAELREAGAEYVAADPVTLGEYLLR
jgi:phosphoglycolate phosphatase